MRTHQRQTKARQSRRGSAVLIVLVMLGIISMLVGSAFVAVNTLKGNLKAIEKRQIKRLEVPQTEPASKAAENP